MLAGVQADRARGERDRRFLSGVFQKLLINFTWWVNRKDARGKHLFSGGFLGLDNIGVPWNCPAPIRPKDIASKFFEHFVHIADGACSR